MMKKLKERSGFTLAETLMTVLILLMVAGVMATGIPSAMQAYAKAVDAANAHVLLSTTVNALRAELATARNPHFKEGEADVLYYESIYTGAKTKLYKAADGTIMVQDYLTFDESGPQGGASNLPRRLVSEKAATGNLQATYEKVDWASGGHEVLDFSGLTVKKDSSVIAEVDELYIRRLNADY